MKEIPGDEYMDYKLPPVVSHSFRHNSVTYKLKLNGGDHSKEPVQYRFFGASYANMFRVFYFLTSFKSTNSNNSSTLPFA